jgi:hypothetical protein
MQRTVPYESVSVVEEILNDGRRVAVKAHTACAVRKGMVQLSVPTPADPVRDEHEIRMARCDVCRQHLWKETDDGEKDVRSASDRKAQEEAEGADDDGRGQEGAAVRESEKHGLERGDMGGYRVKATQVDAEQVQRDVNVSTRRGLITARAGDWVIHDALGVAEVLDGKAFSERYEAVPAEEQVQGVEPGTPDPNTPKDAPRENVRFPEHMQDYLTGRSDEPPGNVGEPGDRDLTDAEAREAAKEPDEKPVVGSGFLVADQPLHTQETARDDPKQEIPKQEMPRQEPPRQEMPRNKGGRPKGRGARGH